MGNFAWDLRLHSITMCLSMILTATYLLEVLSTPSLTLAKVPSPIVRPSLYFPMLLAANPIFRYEKIYIYSRSSPTACASTLPASASCNRSALRLYYCRNRMRGDLLWEIARASCLQLSYSWLSCLQRCVIYEAGLEDLAFHSLPWDRREDWPVGYLVKSRKRDLNGR